MKHHLRRKSGFTLVELAVSVTVASVALVATAGAVTAGAKLARTTAETRTAIRTSASIMERIRATPMDRIRSLYDGAVYDMNEIGGGPSVGECTVAIEDIDTGSTHWGAVKVTVTSTWTGIQGQSSQSFTTWVCDRAEGSSITGSAHVVPATTTAPSNPTGTDPNATSSTGGGTTTTTGGGTTTSTGTGTTSGSSGSSTATDPNATGSTSSGSTTTGGTSSPSGSTSTSSGSSGSSTATTTGPGNSGHSNGNGNGNGNGNSSTTSATTALADKGKKK